MREPEFGPVEEMGLEWKVHIWKWWHPTVKEKALRGWIPTKEEIKTCVATLPERPAQGFAGPKEHRAFQDRLKWGEVGRQEVARELRRQGFEISVPKMTEAKTHEEAWKHSDRGDLFVLSSGKVVAQIEVKRIGERYPFTGPDDWRFPVFLFGPCYKFHQARYPVLGYIVLSPDMKHMGIVVTKLTREQWEEDTRPITDFQRDQTNFKLHPDWILWKDFGDDLTFLRTFI